MTVLLRHLDRAEEHIACLLLFILFAMLTVTIGLRFGFSVGYSWMEEISRVIFVWVVMLGAAAAMRQRAHIRLSFGLDMLPGVWSTAASILGELLLLAFCLATAWYGMELAASTLKISYTMPSSGLSMFWAYLSVPLSFGLQALRILIRGLGLQPVE